jgi:hypothetical protein
VGDLRGDYYPIGFTGATLSYLFGPRVNILRGNVTDADLEKPPSRLSRLGTSARFLRWFLWIQILLGWLLATLFLAGVTGIIRR